jgi:hypothetical protein
MAKLSNMSVSSFVCNLVNPLLETLQMLYVAFGEHSLSWTAVFEWHSRFKASRVSVEDDEV